MDAASRFWMALAAIRAAVPEERTRFIAKPFATEDLVCRVVEMLAQDA